MKDSLYMDFEGTRQLRSQMDGVKGNIDKVLSQIRTVKNNLVGGALELDGDTSVEEALKRLETRARKLSSRMEQYSDIVGTSVDTYSGNTDKWAEIFRRLNTASGNVIRTAGWASGNGVKSSVSPGIRNSFAGITAVGSLLFGSGSGILGADGAVQEGMICFESAGRMSPLSAEKTSSQGSAQFDWTDMTEKECLLTFVTSRGFRSKAETVYDKKGTTGSLALDQMIIDAKQKKRQNGQYWTYVLNGVKSFGETIVDSGEFLYHAGTGQWDEALKDAGDVWNDTINTGQDLFIAPTVYYYQTAMGNEDKGLKMANEISGYNGASGYLRAKGYKELSYILDDASVGYDYVLKVKKFADPKSWWEYLVGLKEPDPSDDPIEFFNDVKSDIDLVVDVAEGDSSGESVLAILKSGKIGKLVKSRNDVLHWYNVLHDRTR